MAKRLVLAAVVTVFCFLTAAWAYDNDDFQVRLASATSFSLAEEISACLYEEFNFGDDAGELACQANELSVTYSGLADWLDITAAYCHLFSRSGDKYVRTYIPWMAGTVKWKMFGSDMSNMLRFDYNWREKADNGWIFKNCCVIRLPFKWTSLDIQPYFSDEVNYNSDQGALTWNEFRSGFSFKLTDKIGVDTYYMLGHSNSGNDTWSRSHTLATQINVSF